MCVFFNKMGYDGKKSFVRTNKASTIATTKTRFFTKLKEKRFLNSERPCHNLFKHTKVDLGWFGRYLPLEFLNEILYFQAMSNERKNFEKFQNNKSLFCFLFLLNFVFCLIKKIILFDVINIILPTLCSLINIFFNLPVFFFVDNIINFRKFRNKR